MVVIPCGPSSARGALLPRPRPARLVGEKRRWEVWKGGTLHLHSMPERSSRSRRACSSWSLTCSDLESRERHPGVVNNRRMVAGAEMTPSQRPARSRDKEFII